MSQLSLFPLQTMLSGRYKENSKTTKPIVDPPTIQSKSRCDEEVKEKRNICLVPPPQQFMDVIEAFDNIDYNSSSNKSYPSNTTVEMSELRDPTNDHVDKMQDIPIEKTRGNFIEDIINSPGVSHDDDLNDIDEFCRNNRKSNISKLEAVTQELYTTLLSKMELMREEESCLEQENHENEEKWNNLQEIFTQVAPDWLVQKFHLHKSEIEKIVALVLSLTGRLVKITNTLENVEWNGVEEREELDKKKRKLTEQLAEAKVLWNSINKRGALVTGSIEQYLSMQEGIQFRRMIKQKVRLMMEMKEIQEKIEISGKQLKAMELL